MKNVLIILSLLFPVSLLAGNKYYFKSTGSDVGAGTIVSPWLTNIKFNSLSLNPDDSVFFNGGDRFPGPFYMTRSGTLGHQIVITSYGTGQALLEGFEGLTGFTVVSGSIQQATCNTCQASVNMVRWYGKNTPTARTPNFNTTDGGYWVIGAGTTTTSILSSSIPSGTAFVGAKLVVHRDNYTFNVDSITAQTTGQFTIAPYEASAPQTGYGVFVKGIPACIDQSGEWAWVNSTRKMQMQVDSTPLATNAIEASAVDTVVTVTGSFTTFKNIAIEGANKFDVAFTANASYDSILNCNIQFSGINGIEVSAGNSVILNNCGFMNSNFAHIKNNGMSVIYPAQVNYSQLKVDSFTYIAMIPGGGASGGASYGGIQWFSLHDSILQCKFYKIGGPAFAQYGGDTNVIKQCFADSTGMLTADVGGFYFSVHSGVLNTFDHCISAHCMGGYFGTIQPTYNYGSGFYQDSKATNVLFQNCLAFGNSYNGMLLHMARLSRMDSLTCVFNGISQVYLQEDVDTAYNNTLTNSILASVDSPSTVMTWYTGGRPSIANCWIGNNNNVYARPKKDGSIFRNNGGATTTYTLPAWKILMGQDAGSTGSPLKISDDRKLILFYNPTFSDSTVQIPQAYVNVYGARQTAGPYVLHPFTSLFLLPQPIKNVLFRTK